MIYALKFDEEPDYSKLRFTLQRCLLERNLVPNKEFDWIVVKTKKFMEKMSNVKSSSSQCQETHSTKRDQKVRNILNGFIYKKYQTRNNDHKGVESSHRLSWHTVSTSHAASRARTAAHELKVVSCLDNIACRTANLIVCLRDLDCFFL